jgi:hypothetical protein
LCGDQVAAQHESPPSLICINLRASRLDSGFVLYTKNIWCTWDGFTGRTARTRQNPPSKRMKKMYFASLSHRGQKTIFALIQR